MHNIPKSMGKYPQDMASDRERVEKFNIGSQHDHEKTCEVARVMI